MVDNGFFGLGSRFWVQTMVQYRTAIQPRPALSLSCPSWREVEIFTVDWGGWGWTDGRWWGNSFSLSSFLPAQRFDKSMTRTTGGKSPRLQVPRLFRNLLPAAQPARVLVAKGGGPESHSSGWIRGRRSIRQSGTVRWDKNLKEGPLLIRLRHQYRKVKGMELS